MVDMKMNVIARCGCALMPVAIACASAAAHAELPQLEYQSEGFDIRVTGGVGIEVAAFSDDDPATQSPDEQFNAFARLNAQWTSPGGVLIGANIEANNRRRESETLNSGEIYGFIASELGRFEVGLQDGAADQLAMAAPLIALGQIRGEFSRFAGSSALHRSLDTRDEFKLIYLSPPVAGFRGGISWSPKANQNENAVDARSRILIDNGFELGLQYQQPVGDWIVGVSGTYATGDADPVTGRADLDSWSVGSEIRRGSLRIGAAYVDRGDSNRLVRGFDQWEINGGLAWVEPEWGVATSAAYTKASDRSNRLIGVGGFYRLTPNLEVRTDLVRFREKQLFLPFDSGVVGILELQLRI